MPVKAVPDGYHSLPPHLVVKGAARARAIDFHRRAFGAVGPMRMPDRRRAAQAPGA